MSGRVGAQFCGAHESRDPGHNMYTGVDRRGKLTLIGHHDGRAEQRSSPNSCDCCACMWMLDLLEREASIISRNTGKLG